MTAKALTEEQMVSLVRNSLLVAGQEMGAEGDHWPVVKSTIHSVMKDWENLKVERNVATEVKTHYETMIREMEAICETCSESLKADIQKALTEIRSIYAACFSSIDKDDLYLSDEDKPSHIKRAEVILKTLEESDD